ncbi:MAG: Flp pilus assembly protein CpaB [Acidimicrobiales bacterium]|nr:Flp pilus assembly protein CpaB [Acidimicrobiales bacterium]
MKKKRVTLIAAIALVVVGTLALVMYVNRAEDRALAGEELVDVLVLDSDVPAGTPAAELQSFVRTEAVPTKVQAEGALASIQDADGMVAKVDLVEGEQLTRSRLVTAEDYNSLQARQGRGGGNVSVPEGLLEITVPLDPVRTVGGTVRPGDLVGVIASFTAIQDEGTAEINGKDTSGFLLHKVLVTNVQGAPVDDPTRAATAEDRAPTPGGNLFVTLAVDAASAERLVFASSYGDVWLAIEPSDAGEAGTAIQTTDRIYG